MEKTATKKSKTGVTNTLNKNVIQFRNNFVNLPYAKESNHELAYSVMSELMQFGYILHPSAISNLAGATKENIINFHNEVVSYLKKMTGSNRNYTAFWPGFPEQVMEMGEIELWYHQIIHYMSNGSYVPNEWTKERKTAFEQSKYTTIDAGNEGKFEKIFTDLVSVNQSLTPDDLDIVKWFVNSGSRLIFPDQIPFKENLCTLAAMYLDVPVKTVTDVLRITVGMSGGDISLPKVPPAEIRSNRWSTRKTYNTARDLFKFKKFSRPERKYILSLLEKTNCDPAEAVLRDQRWIRLGEILHPGEYKTTYPKSFELFTLLRNENIKSWYSKVDASFVESFEAGINALSERPGEFMRKLDWLVRTEDINKKKKANQFSILEKYSSKNDIKKISKEEKNELILKTFKSIAPRVSNKVLFEVFNHFEGRYSAKTDRKIMVKGSRKITSLPSLPAIAEDIIISIQKIIIDTLSSKFSKLPALGSVYLDEKLKNIPLPTNMRSASSGLRPKVRGQRTPIGNQNAKVIRAFVHWFDEYGNQDIDLTATFIGNKTPEHVGWNGTHNGKFGCYSGDIRHRQGACAEYIDINIDAALAEGYKYVVIDARNYNGRSFDTITDCVAGYMEREHAVAAKTFIPSTIADCTRISNESSTTLVSIIDLTTREYIHLDIDMNGIPVASANFEATLKAIKPFCEAPKFSIYNLIELHINGRNGLLTSNKEAANTVFEFDTFSNSYVETLKLMGV